MYNANEVNVGEALWCKIMGLPFKFWCAIMGFKMGKELGIFLNMDANAAELRNLQEFQIKVILLEHCARGQVLKTLNSKFCFVFPLHIS